VKKIEEGLKLTTVKDVAKYSEIAKDSERYTANFKRDAKASCLEMTLLCLRNLTQATRLRRG
jgi:hypothetical protein